LEVDGPGGAVIIDVRIKIESGIEKHGQRIQSPFIQNQSLPPKGGVVEEAPPIHWADGDAGHISIPQNVINIIEGEDPSKELLKEGQPSWMFSLLLLLRPFDQKGHLLRVKGLPFFEWTVGTSSDSFQQRRHFFPYDLLTDLFMIGLESREILLIKEMAEGAMASIVEKPG
jgi:hypothetical protein